MAPALALVLTAPLLALGPPEEPSGTPPSQDPWADLAEPEPIPAPLPPVQTEPQPEPSPGALDNPFVSEEGDLSAEGEGKLGEPAATTKTANGHPCSDPSLGRVPRILMTTDGFHPCEESRYELGKDKEILFYPGLQLRNAIGYVSPFTLDSAGNQFRDNAQVTGRFRFMPRFEAGNAKIQLGFDLVSGRWAPSGSGDPRVDQILTSGQPPYIPESSNAPFPPTAYNMRIFDFREAYFEYLFPRAGVLRVGQQAFTWGLGLVANGGNFVDRYGDMRFGDDGRGGLYDRVLFATKPFANLHGPARDLVVAVGADLVYRDENANLTKGDLAGQGLLVLRYQPADQPGNWLGGYMAFRHQKSADDRDAFANDDLLQVGVFDLAGQGTKRINNKLALIGAFEAAAITGRTRFFSEDGSHDVVFQTAGALRGYFGDPDVWLVGFDGGVASGDNNPNDRTFTAFRTRPGYSAGLILFPYMMGWQSARSQMLAQDDTLAAVDPQGVQYLASGGSATNAVHIQPKARWNFMDRFELWGGPMVAFSPTQVSDPYASRITGGANTNALGGPGDRRYLGTEFDLGVRARYSYKGMWIQGGLQGGVLLPGRAFEDGTGDRDKVVGAVFVRTELRY